MKKIIYFIFIISLFLNLYMVNAERIYYDENYNITTEKNYYYYLDDNDIIYNSSVYTYKDQKRYTCPAWSCEYSWNKKEKTCEFYFIPKSIIERNNGEKEYIPWTTGKAAICEIKITDGKNNIIYDQKFLITSDESQWPNIPENFKVLHREEKDTKIKISINKSDIPKAATTEGEIHYKFMSGVYFDMDFNEVIDEYFNWFKFGTIELDLKPMEIILETELPFISKYSVDCKITDISFDYQGGSLNILYVYTTGEVINGNNHYAKYILKIYDDEGYLICNEDILLDKYSTNDKFRKVKNSIWLDWPLEDGNTYTVKIYSVY